eukprot:TRINITY_DN6937_c0_g1_i1.p2 TRINITY_DN6937_c0_g1~~TRINITY_DN6937_c0_g1_i1.p2  ORF type:complete len:274 (-),score=59.92 TRINITY_DN6937_c0_g1_i1:282-1103(-)
MCIRDRMYDLLVKESVRKYARKIIQDNYVIASSIRDQAISKRIRYSIKSVMMHEMAIDNIGNSLISRVCYKQVRSQVEAVRKDIALDKEIDLEDLSEPDSPNISISSRNWKSHSFKPSSTSAAKKQIKKTADEAKSPETFTSPVEEDTLDIVNQSLLKVSNELQNEKIPFADSQCSKLYKELRETTISALKANWNVASLERLELEPEGIIQIAELNHLHPDLAKHCQHTLSLIRRKIHILLQSKDKYVEDIEDPEFVTYFAHNRVASWRCCRR